MRGMRRLASCPVVIGPCWSWVISRHTLLLRRCLSFGILPLEQGRLDAAELAARIIASTMTGCTTDDGWDLVPAITTVIPSLVTPNSSPEDY